jgi:hypothetical protein
MSLNNIDLWNEIIYDLSGTCDSLEAALTRHNAEQLRDYMPFLEYLDNEIFLCDGCNWWCELSEMSETSDTDMCRDCDDGE